MNYKKIIPNQNIRFFILKTLSFLPAKLMLKLQYFIKFNRNLDLKNPKRFTEKVQHYKLFFRNLEMCNCVDKYLVRDFVVSRGSEQYLNELYGVYNKADDIDFSILPKKFVVKTTDGGGGENVFLCKDKSTLNISSVVRIVNNWRYKDVNSMAYEWAYEGAKKSRIVIEKYLEDKSNTDGSIDDYKFFCFEGKLKYIVVDVDRYVGHKRNFYDANWNLLDVSSDCPKANRELIRPVGLDKMVQLAEKLSKGFPFVRVDLYNIQGKIIFGELTFYPWSGYVKFTPDSFDLEMGKCFNTNY